jgi:ADP-ribosylglycohydrolase
MITPKQKILGCLIGAAAGDAMGAATETRTRTQIVDVFGGPVMTFLPAPDDVFAKGNIAGQVTDDFSLAYETIRSIIQHQAINESVVIDGLREWAKEEHNNMRLAGPTTRAFIEAKIKGIDVPASPYANDNAKATNGAAMKMAPIACFSIGNIEKALDIALTVGQVTHNNQLALSAACAMAAATAKAIQPLSTLDEICQAGLAGATRGHSLALERGANELAGSRIDRRIELAFDIADRHQETTQFMDDLNDYIGAGLMAHEAVPTAFGLFKGLGHSPLECFYAAVNIGNDTDTVATMVGGLLGALYGPDVFPSKWKTLLEEANQYNFDALVEGILATP